MIKTAVFWNKKNIQEYVRYTILKKNKNTKLYIVLYTLCMLAIAVTAAVCAVLTEMYLLMIISAAVVLLTAAFAFLLTAAVKKYSSDILALNTENKINAIEISAQGFLLSGDEKYSALIDWDMISTADFYNDCAYFTTANGLLFIIEKDNVSYGSLDELKAITDEKLVKQVG